MGFLSSVLLCLACLATEDVELRPVTALSFNCARYNGNQLGCQQSPYCTWQTGSTCVDDVCLTTNSRVLANPQDACDSPCIVTDLSATVLNADCVSTTPDTGLLCTTSQTPSSGTRNYDYCAYAYIRDQKCPDSICTIPSSGAAGCVKSNQFDCQLLASETDCGLVPKCWYNSSANQCQQDPCFVGSADVNCANHAPSPLTPGDCVDFKPLKSGSTNIQNYCVYKNNKNPNICYFAGKNVSTSNSNYATDYTQTYPTYNFGSTKPTCAGTISTCEGTGECYTTANKQGALAGLYCTDGTHGNAASVLRVPTLLVLLVVSVLSVLVL